MTVFAVVLWLGWHVWQVKHENETYEAEAAKYGTDENLQRGVENH